ncbi:hypothetical protein [Polaromonas sp.]|uniref:hypothetical protein n=1 Tax=Polaromonas sp. TaxID=1869339 RepID=UPI0013B737BA|nr:hypothetical protein [Polaromonas sp.]NDP61616.1 hypothetical protein [Polaromonas sp.]
MGYFKKSAGAEINKSLARLGALTWILIYGGLLALVWGVWVERSDEDTGWLMMMGGALAAAIGFFLIYIRSKIKE